MELFDLLLMLRARLRAAKSYRFDFTVVSAEYAPLDIQAFGEGSGIINDRLRVARYNAVPFTVQATELKHIDLVIKSKEYENFTQADSPKGEFVPGVRHRGALITHRAHCSF